jgi:hypothetical protein
VHKVFICHHHDNDGVYKEQLMRLNEVHSIFIDSSVDTGDIDENSDDETIRTRIRDEYLGDSSVTIVLVGTETKKRKHVDWEIYSSMYDGAVNKKSGILVINLPTVGPDYIWTAHEGEKETIYPSVTGWESLSTRAQFEQHYPFMPDRVIDSLASGGAKISVTPWNWIANSPQNLAFLVDAAYEDRDSCKYDLSKPMRRSNS